MDNTERLHLAREAYIAGDFEQAASQYSQLDTMITATGTLPGPWAEQVGMRMAPAFAALWPRGRKGTRL